MPRIKAVSALIHPLSTQGYFRSSESSAVNFMSVPAMIVQGRNSPGPKLSIHFFINSADNNRLYHDHY